MVDRRERGWRKPRETSFQHAYEGDPLSDEEIDYFLHEDLRPFWKCEGCEEYLIDIYRNDPELIRNGRYSEKRNGFVCFGCWEQDEYYPLGTVIVFDPIEKTATKFVVWEYQDASWSGPEGLTSDELELGARDFTPDDYEDSPIQFAYHRTDAWRGYYDPIKPKGWIKVHSDSILSYSEDAQHLKNFDAEIKAALWDLGVKFAICFGRTSNVFSTGYDILAEIGEDELKTLAMIMKVTQLRTEYRDPDRFMRTALAGLSEDTKKSRLLAKAAKRLQDGEDFEDVKDDILEEMKA